MNPKVIWRELFQRFCLGDKVKVREDSNWVWKNYVGFVVKIVYAENIPYFLLWCQKTSDHYSPYPFQDNPHLYGYFKYEALEFVG